jgi:16S rRNA (cytosine1402-N4)-methyltransferase
MTYHEPVLLHESIEGLNISATGIYVDVTFGGGGHSREILKHLNGGKLFGFDQDPDAAANVPDDEQFTFIAQNFKHLKGHLRFHGIKQIDGLLADLGVSSHQFDAGHRGFTFREDAALDMRMNQSGPITAADIVNTYAAEDLARIFRMYADLPNAWNLAKTICAARDISPIKSTWQLKEVVEKHTPARLANKFLAQVFQALRIEVNDELGVLKSLIEQATEILKPGGRLVVISYHSLEDRLVKNYMRDGKFEGEADKDLYGNRLVPLKALTRKPLTPGDEENEKNSRARSAKLRIAERTELAFK